MALLQKRRPYCSKNTCLQAEASVLLLLLPAAPF